jgi:iron complex outermembrane recepter protein
MNDDSAFRSYTRFAIGDPPLEPEGGMDDPLFPRCRAALLLVFLLAARPLFAQDPQEVTDIDLEDLMKVRVSSPGKKAQAVAEVPAAVYVIRSEDLRRTGVTSVPEALRRVPGFQVGRQDANSWTVTARGFTSANKLLVLIDGRSVYSPLHSGVFWDVQNVFMEDVERIEVIRGPGGALWGANAVNGIVNVITKSAKDTQGGVVYAGGGTEERYFGGARYGAPTGEGHQLRVSANTFTRDDSVSALDPDDDLFDDLQMSRADLRWDWKSGNDRVSLIGGYYDGKAQERQTTPTLSAPFSSSWHERTKLSGGHVILRWEREFSPTQSFSAQLYYDRVERDSGDLFQEEENTGDLDLQYRFSPFEGHDVVCGAGYRIYGNDFNGSFFATTDPEERVDDLPSAFLQDEITLVERRLKFTLGAKVEHNDYSGLEFQPSARLAWTPHDDHMIWLAASRAMRTPSILDNDFRLNALAFPGAPPTVLAVFGQKDFRGEELISFEAGYRSRPWDPLTVDVATFYNVYDDLRSLETGAVFAEPSNNVQPFNIQNEATARTYGVEVALNFQAAPWWLFQASYAYLYMNIQLSSSSNDTTSEAEEKKSPRNQVWIRSAMDLPYDLTLDVMARYVSRLTAVPADAYVEGDIRLAWRMPGTSLELALVGQNVVHEHHEELSSDQTGSELERAGYVSLTWRY